MANYATLKAAIADVVKTNGSQAITGTNLQTVLLSIVNSIGSDYLFAGVATPETSTGTPDQNVFWITGGGTFANFGTTVTVPDGSIGIFKYNGSWTSDVLNVNTMTESVTTWGTGYIDSSKNVVYLDGWSYADVAVSAAKVNQIKMYLTANGATAYCYLLNASNGTLLSWNNTIVDTVIDLDDYPTAARLLVCSRTASTHYITLYTKMEYYVEQGIKEYLSSTVDDYNSGMWNKPSTMKLMMDGKLWGVGVPNNNTAMAFFTLTNRCWWVGAKFNHGSVPAIGTDGSSGINAGLVMSANTQGRSFMMAKILSRSSSVNKIDMFYNINGFTGLGTLNLTQTAGSDIIAKIAVSAKRLCVYTDDTLIGSANGVIPMGDRVFGGILMSNNNMVSEFSFGNRPSRYAHFSVDDVGALMKRISESSITSIFQNETFSFLQEMHNNYGLTVTLNLFVSINDGTEWTIDSFPDTFKSELTNANYWLKFAFHGGDESIRYNSESNNAAALSSYSSFVSNVSRFASLGSIDLMPRLTYFSGNKTLLNSLRETKMFLGCLTADDNRDENCGLNATERAAINGGSDYIDFANKLYYARSRVRFDTQTTQEVTGMLHNDIDKKLPVLEYFTHGADGFTTKDKASIEVMAQMLAENGIRMDFAMNNMPF